MQNIPKGASYEKRMLVTTEIAIDHLGREDARVLATPHLVWQLELAARDAILPFLDEGEESVGTEVHLRHLAATPIGMSVAFRARVEDVEGRRVRFVVEAEDEREVVASGTHERFVIQIAKFVSRLAAKRAR
ncbi:MAG TPA: thioesterase family protein [Bryobacteraceae bacterium]|jgi:fluoroacetyl-CoA thioesterase|nr:thioesterase family protein [Bryobacteraceae bacterium]